MNFIQTDKPKNTNNNTTYGGKGTSSIISGGGTSLTYLELTEIQKSIKSGVIKKTIESSGGFGSITGGTSMYLIDDGGFIFSNIDTSGVTTNIASIDTNGVFNAKEIKLHNGTNNVTLKLDANGNLTSNKTFLSEGDLIAFSDGSSTGGTNGGGGLIQTVYGYLNLGNTFLNTDLTSTFNAYTINEINNKIITLEGGSATSINTTGSGNSVTSITKNGTIITVNKGSNFSLDSHNHSLSSLSEKSYNSLTDKPTSLSQFTNNLGNYGGFLTGITSSQVTTALGYTPYSSTNPSGYATTNYVDTSISNLIGGAPASLNTLREIADSLNNNTALESTLINSIATKANQSSESAYDYSIGEYITADVHLSLYSDTSNYAISAGYSDSSNSSTYATYDSYGNDINNTYLKLAGGTMSNTNMVFNLNADLLDGKHASFFSPTTHTHNQYLNLSGGTITGNLIVNHTSGLTLKNGTKTVNITVDSNGNLVVDKTILSSGDLIAFSDGSVSGGTGGGGGLIQTVYAYNNLGGTFLNTNLTDTFNAYTINQINNRLVSVENGSATTINTTGTGNGVTSITKSGNVITINKGSNFSLDSHNHSLNNLTEKSYNSLTDKPTNLSQFTNNSGFITGINSSQVITALGYTPSNSNHNHSLNNLTEKSYNSLTDKPTSLSQFTNNLGNYGGFLTGINSSQVTTALGYTPSNSNHTHSYLPLNGTADNAGLFDSIDSDKFTYGDNSIGVKFLEGLDANEILKAGFYSLYQTTNAPFTGDGGLINIPAWKSNYVNEKYNFQIASNIGNNGTFYMRNTWSDGSGTWRELYHTGNFTPSDYLPVGGTALYSDIVSLNNNITYGKSGLQFGQTYGNSSIDLNDNPFEDWFSHIVLNHGNAGGYYQQISTCFHSDDVYYRRLVNGTYSSYKRFLFDGDAILSKKLTVNSSNNTVDILSLMGYTNSEFIFSGSWNGNNNYLGLRHSTASVPSLLMADNGNIGIGNGTLSPTEKLDVNGKIKTTELIDNSKLKSYGFPSGVARWVRIAKLKSPLTGEAYGTISINNSYYYNSPSPITFTFGCTYRSGINKYINQLGGVTEIFDKVRIVYPTGTDDDYYIEVFCKATLGGNVYSITLSNSYNVELLPTYTVGDVPVTHTTYQVNLINGVNIDGKLVANGNFEFGNGTIADANMYIRGIYGVSYGWNINNNSNGLKFRSDKSDNAYINIDFDGQLRQRSIDGWGNNIDYYINKNLGNHNDYIQHVILLHEIYNGTLINRFHCNGTITASRGGTTSGLINDTYHVNTSTAYSEVYGALNCSNGVGELVTCMYGGKKYIALKPFYRVSAVGYTFVGNTFSTGEFLKVVSYRNSNTSAILNSEINNSITTYQNELNLTAKSLFLGSDFSITKNNNSWVIDAETSDSYQNSLLIKTGAETHLMMGVDAGGYNYLNIGSGGDINLNSYDNININSDNYVNINSENFININSGEYVYINTQQTNITGNLLVTGEITAYSTSDERLKENIKPITDSLNIINKLNPVSYNWNSTAKELNPNKTDKTDIGLIAQDVEKLLPNIVHGIYNDEYKSIDYIKIIPLLISSIQELTKEINELKNKK